LPDEDLNRFRITREQLLSGQAPPSGLMALEWERARSYYQVSAPLLGLVRPASRPALWAMMAIYYGILLRIKSQGYDVYRQRPRLTALQKTWIVVRAARTRWFGGALPFPG
jgi:phytoene/squalene synthetase